MLHGGADQSTAARTCANCLWHFSCFSCSAVASKLVPYSDANYGRRKPYHRRKLRLDFRPRRIRVVLDLRRPKLGCPNCSYHRELNPASARSSNRTRHLSAGACSQSRRRSTPPPSRRSESKTYPCSRSCPKSIVNEAQMPHRHSPPSLEEVHRRALTVHYRIGNALR